MYDVVSLYLVSLQSSCLRSAREAAQRRKCGRLIFGRAGHGSPFAPLFLELSRISAPRLSGASLVMRPITRWPLAHFSRPCTRRTFATVTDDARIPQTVIEKVVQKYAVGLPAGKVVQAGDYVMIRPEHVMTHDNTGPVISKCVGHAAWSLAGLDAYSMQVQVYRRDEDT
jgi:hypothetical protein